MSLDAIIQKVRALGGLAAAAARSAAPMVEAQSKKTAAAGTDPNGKQWAPKKDGGAPLVNAADAVSVVAIGTVVQIRLGATSTGSAKAQAIQNTRRQIIPANGEGIPAGILKALDEGANKAFREAVGS